MVDIVGRAEVDARCGQDGWKIEDEDRGRTGHPNEFSNPKLNIFDIFIDVHRNF